MNGAQYVVAALQGRGVPFLSVLCGNGLDPLLAAAAEAGLRVVDARNEQGASYVADTYARLTGRLGACAVSSGVAHVNAMAGLLNAHYDGAPMLLISGASPAATLGRGGFQDLDQAALARPICKRAEFVGRADRLPQALTEALAAAAMPRQGPVHLTIPVDVLSAELDEAIVARWPVAAECRVAEPGCDARAIQEAAQMLAQAQRPLIVAGTGLFYADAGDALQTLADAARIPIVTPIWDRGVVAGPSDTFLGVIGAASGEPVLVPEADLIVLAGARVDYRVRYLDAPPLAKGRRILRLSADPTELCQGVTPDLALLADPREALLALGAAWRNANCASHENWLRHARSVHATFYGRWDAPLVGVPGGWRLVEALRPLLTEQVTFLVDGGNIGQWAHMRLCRDRYPAHWITCGASAVVGWGVPGAIGARLARPQRPVLLLSGDGAIGFGLPEFESAARQGIPFVAIVADDRAWGIVVSGQEAHRGGHRRTIASELSAVDYAGVARALGARGVRVEAPDALAQAVREGWASGQPTLIHAPIARGGPADVA